MSQPSGSFGSQPPGYAGFGDDAPYLGADGAFESSSSSAHKRKRRMVLCGGLLIIVAVVALVLGMTLSKNDSSRSAPPATESGAGGGVGVGGKGEQGAGNETFTTGNETSTEEGGEGGSAEPEVVGGNIEQLQSLLPFLSAASPDGGASLSQTDPPSPQYEAAAWLSADPGIDALSDDRKLARYALSTLYHATSSAFGTQWTDVGGWDQHELDECDWNGVECTANGAVTMLNVTFNNVRGELPTEVLLLTDLGEYMYCSIRHTPVMSQCLIHIQSIF